MQPSRCRAFSCEKIKALIVNYEKRKGRSWGYFTGSGHCRNGVPGRIRTFNLLIRSQVLYPVELRVRWAGSLLLFRRGATLHNLNAELMIYYEGPLFRNPFLHEAPNFAGLQGV